MRACSPFRPEVRDGIFLTDVSHILSLNLEEMMIENRLGEEVTLIFEPQSGGAVEEREPGTHTLRQFVAAVFQKLRVTNAVNPTVQRVGHPGAFNLDAAVDALGLKNGSHLNLAWQTSGGVGCR
jgi:hypothetical protein